ncbi:MAG TPA: M23 family metallopeptidase [Candidatus Krumholzibacteriaceae bacterium]|nr:M23 family metallopeptidase [Candidatus Krumholzibacteriaceae bacterium]
MKDKFSVIIVPHDERKTRTYRIPYRVFYAVIAFAAVSIIAMAVFAATYGKLLFKAREIIVLQDQVEKLTRRNENLKEIVGNIDKISKLSKEVRTMLGVESGEKTAAGERQSRILATPEDKLQDEKDRMLRAVPSFWPVRGFLTKKFNVDVEESSPDYHQGIDIAVQRGEPVRAAASGYVIDAGWDEIYGYFVSIDHGYGIKSLYGHNERIVVKEEEKVERGQTIAYSGNSGRSSAPHLHFEVSKNNLKVNPLKYLLK